MSLVASSTSRSLRCSSCHSIITQQQQRAASTSLWQRIKTAAQNAAINQKPVQAKIAREIQRREVVEHGRGSIYERASSDGPSTSTSNLAIQAPSSSSSASAARTAVPSSADTWIQHKTSTGNIPMSPRKLNDVARLIAKKPIDSAILQMQMSDKRVAKTRIKSMLALARDHAVMKGLARDRLIVKEAWVSKGVYLKRLDIKGRGRHGIIMKPEARMHVVLAPGPTRAEQKKAEFDKRLRQALRTGAGYAREDRKIINIGNLKGAGTVYAW